MDDDGFGPFRFYHLDDVLEGNLDQAAGLYSFESPESALVARASYDADAQVLTVTVHTVKGERAYTYSGPTLNLWREFEAAESKGRFFSANIRPLYLGRVRP